SLWEQVGEKSKSSALRTAAIKNADGISEGLLKLAEQLEQYAADPTNEPMLSLVLQIAKKCPGACDVLDACKSSDDTEAKGKTEMISAGIEKVRRILESSYNGSTSFGDSLDTFWVDELYLKQPDNATATLTVFFRNLMIEGRQFDHSLFLPTGEIYSTVLGRKKQSHLLDVSKVLLDFHLACPDLDSITLEQACNLQAKLEKLNHKIQQIPGDVSDGVSKWATPFQNAGQRFSKLLVTKATSWIQDMIKESGTNGAWKYLLSCPSLPSSLKPFSAVIAQATFLDELKVP
ncbi:unnamed protein product, partial [Durusdinium trenchii]